MEMVLAAVIALFIGAIAGYLAGAKKAGEQNKALEAEAQRKADRVMDEAREEAQSLVRKAESEARQAADKTRDGLKEELEKSRRDHDEKIKKEREELKANLEKEREEHREEQVRSEARLEDRDKKLTKREELQDKRDENLDRRAEMYDVKEQELVKREKQIQQLETDLEARKASLEALNKEAEEKLSRVAGMTAQEARQQLIDRMTGEAKLEAGKLIKTIEEEAIAEADRRAKKVIGVAIQRYAGEYVTERTVSVLPIPSDDLKGRIIGREGRNIRALEAATGINLIIDDTPEAVVLSGFNPVAREVARLSLERLIADGRIHPSRIEEVVEKTRSEVDKRIKDAGETAAFELGLHNIHPELLKLLGKLRYRTSYGQNQWTHSIEVGFLCGMMASELGLNTKLARRAGLLHDIGKAVSHEMEGSHAVNGGEFCRKFGEDPIIVNAVAAHHEDVPPKSVYAHLVMAADALSGARPGARREILETYIRRLEDLERISSEFEGVEKSFAIQAGREIRVMVEHTRVNDEQAHMLSKDIARRIEKELTYPGQIKVCVIRETRAVDFAR